MPILESVRAVEPAKIELPCSDDRTVLSIGPSAEDHAILRRMVADLHWQVRSVRTCWKALERLQAERFGAIFCDDVMEDGSWKDILNQTGTGAGAQPLIVTSRLADGHLWSEVLNLGGYDVLLKPLIARDVAHVLTTISLHPVPKSVRIRTAGVV